MDTPIQKQSAATLVVADWAATPWMPCEWTRLALRTRDACSWLTRTR